MISKGYRDQGQDYLFAEMAQRVHRYRAISGCTPLDMGVGDVRLPVAPCVAQAMSEAAVWQCKEASFRGYSPYFGYDFAREAVCDSYAAMGTALDADEVYITAGAKETLAAWMRLVRPDVPVLVADPTYPAYRDLARLHGHELVCVAAHADNGYCPDPVLVPPRPYLIVLCSPANPTGATYDDALLGRWIHFALETRSLLLLDAAYQAFSPRPHSIYAIEGSSRCCIEIGTLSKSASFSGLRCGWAVVPASLALPDVVRAWRTEMTTACNGVSFVTQWGAKAALSEQGRGYSARLVACYRRRAAELAEALRPHCMVQCGPYLWVKMPYHASGWQYFDRCLAQGVVVTPGEGFGAQGEGHIRLSVFGLREEEIPVAVERLSAALGDK